MIVTDVRAVVEKHHPKRLTAKEVINTLTRQPPPPVRRVQELLKELRPIAGCGDGGNSSAEGFNVRTCGMDLCQISGWALSTLSGPMAFWLPAVPAVQSNGMDPSPLYGIECQTGVA